MMRSKKVHDCRDVRKEATYTRQPAGGSRDMTTAQQTARVNYEKKV